jgi:hypothetical protein
MIEKQIYNTAIADGLPPNMANLLVAQSKHETGNYTSNAYLKNNNLFGYKYVKGAKFQVGPGIKSSESDPYAHYSTINDSVHELTAWIERRQGEGKFPVNLTTLSSMEYAVLLKNCGYFGDPLNNYISGLNHYSGDYA